MSDIQQEIDTAYLAGLFDGRGKVRLASLSKDRPRRLYVVLGLASTPSSEELLTEMLVTWGGRVHRSADRRLWKWELQSNKAADFLEDIISQLTLQREPAELALSWQRNRPTRDQMPSTVELREYDDKIAAQIRRPTDSISTAGDEAA